MNKRLALVGNPEDDEPIILQRISIPDDTAFVLDVLVGKAVVETHLALGHHGNILGVAGRVAGDVEDHRGIRVEVSSRVDRVGRGHLNVDLLGARFDELTLF